VGRLLNFHEVGEISASRKSVFLRSDQTAACIRRRGLQKTHYYYAEKKVGRAPFFSANRSWSFSILDPPRKTEPQEVGNFSGSAASVPSISS
jgi:hypothetical protein